MHPDLTIVTNQLLAAQAEIHRLAASVDESTWVTRPAPTSWSMSECIGHLTLTTEAFLPAMRDQLQRPESRARRAPGTDAALVPRVDALSGARAARAPEVSDYRGVRPRRGDVEGGDARRV
ncbi:MAG: DinB family protein [Gemmatimonadetes bacterium]|nr:DinB family protein [Gemmatimonadota bacterium]